MWPLLGNYHILVMLMSFFHYHKHKVYWACFYQITRPNTKPWTSYSPSKLLLLHIVFLNSLLLLVLYISKIWVVHGWWESLSVICLSHALYQVTESSCCNCKWNICKIALSLIRDEMISIQRRVLKKRSPDDFQCSSLKRGYRSGMNLIFPIYFLVCWPCFIIL